ncbi:Utp14 protein-domain-containing protein [Cercophora scortea]|uniref:Utp14 protein-domain-containing protein n=1 Tax=Cercophora scortea TaxID=314031 RepID=A0AAE0MI86_9PEZI|nr:Utp14 protein-domain-containing protein [Cercophora scortea]
MPGRQAHGRPLLPSAKVKAPKNVKKSRAQKTSKALDAFALAEAIVPQRTSKGVRTRDLEEEPERPEKRGRDDDDEDDDDDDDDDDAGDAPPQKKARKNDDEFDGFSGSDSEGEEWHVGVGSADEDSDIDSEEAFGDSDNEKFDGFAFSGSAVKKSKKQKKQKGGDSESEDEEEEEDDDDDLESLGSDAIDLATALDQYSEEESAGEEESDEADGSSDELADSDDDGEDEIDPSALLAGFGGDDEDGEQQSGTKPKSKLSLKDLGLFGVKDPHIKKSLKLMNKEEKANTPSASKKLAVPLAKRQQDRLLRSAAYEKTSETLERWIGTVSHNRRADHLVFPLAQNAEDKGLDNGELMPLTEKTAGTELEQTILAIMEESGLGPSVKAEKRENPNAPDPDAGLTPAELKEVQRQRRREREMHSREAVRAKRIKKIKSKAYRRIHRKEAFHDEEKAHAALAAAGELDSEEEREAEDRRRALERVGTKHRESKWAKLGKKAGRAVWDEDFRTGLTEMAQRKEDLRRRIEGRSKNGGGDDEPDSDASMESGDEVDKRRLLEELNRAAADDDDDDDEPKSALMQMKFMQRGEAQRKKENDELVEQIRRDLNSDDEGEDADIADTDIGRRQFGMGNKAAAGTKVAKNPFKGFEKSDEPSKSAAQVEVPTVAEEPEPAAPGAAGAWSRAGIEERKSLKSSKKSSSKSSGKVEELDFSNAAMLATARPSKQLKTKTAAPIPATESSSKTTTVTTTTTTTTTVTHESDDEDAIHLPMAIRDQELIKRAFAGEDVVGEFAREKAEMENEDDDKEIDNTLPGWGGWVGEGVSNREKARHKGRFVTKVEGVKKKDRKDFKLKTVIISEKKIRKNDKYLASALPHPFESQQQYERSLRLPVGPEWTTKETFQEATKPRVIIKQGIIAPMSKPMV